MSRMKRDGHRERNFKIRAVFVGVLIVALLAAGSVLGRKWELSQYQEQRGQMSSGFGQIPTIEVEGVTYEQKMNLTTVLLIGTDRRSDEVSEGYRDGGQADFLLLAVVDHDAKTIRQLQIDRDTIVPVSVLGLFGNKAGSRDMQICLAHGYGVDKQERCKNTLASVQALLGGQSIELYVEIPLDGIGALNDLLGGVTVTLLDDFTASDPTMTAGKTLTLTGQQAEILVRSRMSMAVGTNEARMSRQRIFMDAAVPMIRERISENSGFASEMLDSLSPYLTTNMVRGRMINELNKAYHYDVQPVEYLTGEHTIGDDGFVEFHAASQSAVDFVLSAFYTKMDAQ